jgi:hypothetical protein
MCFSPGAATELKNEKGRQRFLPSARFCCLRVKLCLGIAEHSQRSVTQPADLAIQRMPARQE